MLFKLVKSPLNIKSASKYFIFFVAVLVLFSLGLHLIDAHHHHAESVYGVGLDAVMHAADRKWFFILSLFLLPLLPLITRMVKKRYAIFFNSLSSHLVGLFFVIPRLFDSFYTLIQSGAVRRIIYE